MHHRAEATQPARGGRCTNLAKLRHPIQDVTREDRLGLLGRGTACSKALAEDRLVPEEGVLHAGLLMVAGVLLPLAPSHVLHLADRAVASGRARSPSRDGGRSGRRDEDLGPSRRRRLVDADRVVGRVGREAGDLAVDLGDQIEDQRLI